MSKEPCERRRGQEKVAGQDSEMGAGPIFFEKNIFILFAKSKFCAYSGDTRSPIPVISVHSAGNLQYRRQS